MDVGGISGTTWTALRWKMCSKSVVFKVDSGYADWWHLLLRPFEHYIPVQQDLSDLKQQYDWAEAHPILAQQIATNALQVCQETTDAEYLRRYTRQQIQAMPSPTDDQMGQYYALLEDSRRRLQQGQPALMFKKTYTRFKKTHLQCPPELSKNNI